MVLRANLYVVMQGLRVGRIRTIFKIPTELESRTFGVGMEPPGHLAYVDWFTKLGTKDTDSGMYPLSYSRLASGIQESSIIEVACIVRTCHLFPSFGRSVNTEWTSENVLDCCSRFYLSNWKDKLTYQTIY